MAEYIEREALIERLENSPLFTNFGEDGHFICNGVIDIIKRQSVMKPTADVVEVVRCKDCVSYNGHRYCNYHADPVMDDDFCSYGEAKMDGGKDND